MVQFGETEIRASDLKSTLETLKRTNDGNKKSELELEFDVSCIGHGRGSIVFVKIIF